VLQVAKQLYDISVQISVSMAHNVVFVPYRMPGSDNPLGPYTNFALRTFSQRGYIPFWSMGRNAYFDSMVRHRNEERSFQAAGLTSWDAVLPELDLTREREPIYFYTGWSPKETHNNWLTPSVRVMCEKRTEMVAAIDRMSPSEVLGFAKKLGGTHLFISKGQNFPLPFENIILENDFFAVVPVD